VGEFSGIDFQKLSMCVKAERCVVVIKELLLYRNVQRFR